MTLLDIFRAVVALAAPAWCPPSLAAASHEFARHRRDWVEGQAVRSLVAAVPALGRDLGQRRVMASLWDGRATTLPTPRGQRGFPSRATLEQEAVFTPEVLALLFWSRAVVQWYWMGTTLPTADGTMELTTYEIQVNFPVRHRVVMENEVHLTLCDFERFFVQVLVLRLCPRRTRETLRTAATAAHLRTQFLGVQNKSPTMRKGKRMSHRRRPSTRKCR